MECNNFKCDICKKYYKSYQSLWKHKKIYHVKSKPDSKPEVVESKPDSKPKVYKSKSEVSQNEVIVSQDVCNSELNKEYTNKYKCKFCSNEYKFKQSKWKHEQKCNKKNYLEELIKQNAEKDKKIEEIKQSFEKFKKQMIDMMNQKYKMHPKTFQKMINSNNLINSNNNITINNNINNIKYIEIGREDLPNVFTKDEKIMLLTQRGSPIENIMRYAHLNDKYPQLEPTVLI